MTFPRALCGQSCPLDRSHGAHEVDMAQRGSLVASGVWRSEVRPPGVGVLSSTSNPPSRGSLRHLEALSGTAAQPNPGVKLGGAGRGGGGGLKSPGPYDCTRVRLMVYSFSRVY